mgnify:CR=1 FL=1
MTVASRAVGGARRDLEILAGVDFALARGEAVAIMGASGSGKSTLLGLLAGLERATSGDIILDGTALGALDEDQRAALRRRRIGFVFQSFHLLPALNALDNVRLALDVAGLPDAAGRAWAALDKVGLAARAAHFPGELSGGEQQRVALARAFCTAPLLLLADEPTGNLDRRTGRQIADLMFDLQAAGGTSLVLVTHDETLAARCDRRLLLEDGRLAVTA